MNNLKKSFSMIVIQGSRFKVQGSWFKVLGSRFKGKAHSNYSSRFKVHG